jgi:glutathione synthase/RimK-type ligase-like ATP-grasp enzyme
MNNDIILLTDYKGFFGSKQKGPIYRGGMDIPLLIALFSERGYNAEVIYFKDLNVNTLLQRSPVILYTSSEDNYGYYKSYIEDIVFNLEKYGLTVIPDYSCLAAHNNKIAMELMRDRSNYLPIQTIKSRVFGTIEELESSIGSIVFPAVIKPSSGAMSKGVYMAENADELLRKAKTISKTRDFGSDLKESLRKIKYGQKYIKESSCRKKFIVQNLIPDLSNDWKILVFGSRCYVLFRGNRKNDFRASGSGRFEFRKELPEGILDYAYKIKEHFNVPHISLDIGYDGDKFHLIEFQFIYFGTTTIEKAPFSYEKTEKGWQSADKESVLEDVYTESVIYFLEKRRKFD